MQNSSQLKSAHIPSLVVDCIINCLMSAMSTWSTRQWPVAGKRNRLDGLIAAAGINHVGVAIDHSPAEIADVMSITGVSITATATAKQTLHYKSKGSIVLVSSISGIIANNGMVVPVYHSSKAAAMQLGRSLAMEWGRVDEEGRGGIRVNSLRSGHIITHVAIYQGLKC
jgi:NAD(P)-dependent dehydrogenase (short-subunit alcohol dehydrogenase family)